MSLEICNCRCHEKDSNIKHIVACCIQCAHCKQRIKSSFSSEHSTKCSDQYEPKINGVHILEILNAFKVLEEAGFNMSDLNKQAEELLAGILNKD